MAKGSKRLVIDASVAQAAGGRENPTSKNCTDFLETVREAEHLLVMTPDIFVEWQNHASFFASTWRAAMVARKKAVLLRADQVINPTLREKIDRLEVTDKSRSEMLKDVHLLEAAIFTDKIVSSLNSVDKKRFALACDQIIEIADILWVNPNMPEEKCIEWLQSGASPDKHRQLGYREPED